MANIDLRRITRRVGAAAATAPNDDLAEVVIPPDAARHPPSDASFIIRARQPSGGGYARDERAVVWREADGAWWGWRKILNGDPASPPPPPASGTAEALQHARDHASGHPWSYDPYPPYEGQLSPEQSARMEAAYADPCRRLEPDIWPWEIPLLRAEEGRRVRRCQLHQDFTPYYAEFTEAGRPPRRIGLPCGSPGSLNGVLVTHAAHVELPRTAPRRLSPN